MQIEYAPKLGGPWRSLGTLGLTWGDGCRVGGHLGGRFSGQFTAKLPAAYYRAVYRATPDWQATASDAVYLHRILTKIATFSVTPRSVARNGSVTVSGHLLALGSSGTWHAYGDRTVMVIYKYKGIWYRYKYEPVTSASGWFKASFTAHASSPFFAQYDGDATHFACASRRVDVAVT